MGSREGGVATRTFGQTPKCSHEVPGRASQIVVIRVGYQGPQETAQFDFVTRSNLHILRLECRLADRRLVERLRGSWLSVDSGLEFAKPHERDEGRIHSF